MPAKEYYPAVHTRINRSKSWMRLKKLFYEVSPKGIAQIGTTE